MVGKRFLHILVVGIVGLSTPAFVPAVAQNKMLSSNESGLIFISAGKLGNYEVVLKTGSEIIDIWAWLNTGITVKKYIVKPGKYKVYFHDATKKILVDALPNKYSLIEFSKNDAYKPYFVFNGVLSGVDQVDIVKKLGRVYNFYGISHSNIEDLNKIISDGKKIDVFDDTFVFEAVPDRRPPPPPKD